MPKLAHRSRGADAGPSEPVVADFMVFSGYQAGAASMVVAAHREPGGAASAMSSRPQPAAAGSNCPPHRSRRAVLAGRGTAFAAAFLLVAGLPAEPAATPLQAHRAVYVMSLATTPKRSEVAAADGRMLYRFARSCDGWTVENRTLLRLSYEGGRDVNTVWTFASWESLDGLRFHFHARYEQDGETVERLDGEAQLDGRGKGGKARFTRPEERTVDLPAGAAFPTEHVRLMIDAAERGGKTLAKVVFDGASLDNPYFVNAVFGPLQTAAAETLAKAAGLPLTASWWTRMAFFPIEADEPLPEFEISADYRSDGIADRVVQQFREFSLNLRLRELELIPPPDC